jgi:hypothetical protein
MSGRRRQNQEKARPVKGATSFDSVAVVRPNVKKPTNTVLRESARLEPFKDNPVKPVDAALYGQLSRIGLTDGGFDPSKLPEATRKGLAAGLKDGPRVAYASLTSNAVIRKGWTWATSLDKFGYKYPLRAMVARPLSRRTGRKGSHVSDADRRQRR